MKVSPTGERMQFKAYPKNDQHRTLSIGQPLIELLSADITTRALARDDLLFPSSLREGTRPVSRNTFRTKVWLPALGRAGLDFHVRVHDLRHALPPVSPAAPTSWWSKRLGHRRITTTQQYTGTLPDAGDRALSALRKIRNGATPRQPRDT